MKKTKQPGDNISLKTKKNEDPAIMQWLNSQTNLMDSLRYLIEKEVHQNGVRNLQAFIPMERNFSTAGSSDGGLGILEPNRELAAAAAEVSEEEVQKEPEQQVEDEIDDEDIESWT